MSMKPYDLLEPDTIELVRNIRRTINDLEPIMIVLRDEGFPIREHYDRFMEHKSWLEKVEKIFSLTN